MPEVDANSPQAVGLNAQEVAETAQDVAQQVGDVLQSIPAPWLVTLLVGAAVGLVLLLFGGRLARPGCSISGFVLGGLAGLIGSQQLFGGGYLLPLVIGGAVMGCLLAWLLFRVWMAMSGGLLLALAAPAAVIIWQGTPLPERAEGPDLDPQALVGPLGLGAVDGAPLTDEQQSGAMAELRQRLGDAYQRQAEAIRGWWEQLGSRGRMTLSIAAMIGAAFGLMLGLLAPYAAATVQSGIAGAILILVSSIELTRAYLPDQAHWLPGTPRAMLLTLGLITLVGIGFQWTLRRRKTDK